MEMTGRRPRGRPKRQLPAMTMPSNLRSAKNPEERYKLVDATCEAIDSSFAKNGKGLRLSAFTPDAYAYICAAYRSFLMWTMTDEAGISLPEKNLRRRRFIILLSGAYEAASWQPACRPYKVVDEKGSDHNILFKIDGHFFRFAKIVILNFGSSDFLIGRKRAEGEPLGLSDKALRRLIDEALKRLIPQRGSLTQYRAMKAEAEGFLLFYHVGRFYELAFSDAEVAAKALGLPLTKHRSGEWKDIPTCRVWVFQAEDCLQRLIAEGHSVAFCGVLAEGPQCGQRVISRLATPS
jgi:MutS domain I